MSKVKIVFFSPPEYVESILKVVFEQGAGKIGEYDMCCFRSSGVG